MFKLILADVYSGLFHLDDNSLDVAITSPPYWGQRDYGFEGQIGNEINYNDYIGKLTTIYRLLRQKLNKKGIFFLNIGDKYLSKYGNSPLGMIPYKLAYFMTLDGWILNDIIIWYKPNHMPSSVRNRFTNSYEPIFVFSKSKENIFLHHKRNNRDYSNILKVTLQSTPYKHVAVFPEKLVLNLLNMVNLNRDSKVLDPFAGSGTTLKAVQTMNKLAPHKKISAIMIENSEIYVKIIKDRCSLSNTNIDKYPFKSYNYKPVDDRVFYNFLLKKELKLKEEIDQKGFLKVCTKKKEYYQWLSLFLNGEIGRVLNRDTTCFIGTKEFDIELIYNTSLLNKYGWILRNMIVVENRKTWFPVFMIVDDNKSLRYRFNYKNLDLKNKDKYKKEFHEIDFVGYQVFDNLRKKKLRGVVAEVLERNPYGFPRYVIVKWENATYTKEFVIFSEKEVSDNLILTYDEQREITLLEEKDELIGLNTVINYDRSDLNLVNNVKKYNRNYNGKFKNEIRKNWGASPGARASMVQDFFSKRRLYNVSQSLVSDLLNYKRVENGLTKKVLTDMFPTNYKHTVGHWLRKDFGGSIPLPEDWEKLVQILRIEDSFTNCICKTALKLQAVQQSEYKLPDDFLSIGLLKKLTTLLE